MVREFIKEYVEAEILPRYSFFDKGHSVSHARTVIEESLALAQSYDVDEDMVYLIAAYHDTGLVEGRERHHIVSGEILLADSFVAEHFTLDQREIMRDAIEDHRASSKSEPRTIYGRIVAEADRVISPEITLQRTVQYGLKMDPMADRTWHYDRFCEHLMAKYAPGGYLKLYIPQSGNGERLKILQSIIADPAELRRRFDAIFDAETASL